MYCPRCGQQQATDAMRFCSRCGFPMEGTMQLLAHGGMLPVYQEPSGEKKISPRRRGVKQGALIMLLGVLLVPILGVFSNYARHCSRPARFKSRSGQGRNQVKG